jgi:SpoVK/Ycf46/Vps4 family AAA+-type ATPase
MLAVSLASIVMQLDSSLPSNVHVSRFVRCQIASELLAGDSAAATIKRIELSLQVAVKSSPCVLFFDHVNVEPSARHTRETGRQLFFIGELSM